MGWRWLAERGPSTVIAVNAVYLVFKLMIFLADLSPLPVSDCLESNQLCYSAVLSLTASQNVAKGRTCIA
jgi:hypothetical protein